MLDNYIGPRRDVPLHTAAQQDAAAQDTAQDNTLQADTAAADDVQLDAQPTVEEFTISVEQVRAHFRAKGLHKSKDTVQRWCRTGELTCQKRGVLNRYFTTEASLNKLEEKLLPDMIAESSGETRAASEDAQTHAAALATVSNRVPLHATESEAAYNGKQQNTGADAREHAGASSTMKPDADDAPGTQSETGLVDELRAQLKSKQNEIEFLREEVRASRDQRGAVVQISNRMLETLETIAIGGRLERSNPTGAKHSPPTSVEADRVY